MTHYLKPGDVMVIPAGTGHWFTKIDNHITCLMIRLDLDKIVPLKNEAASRADLSGTSGRTGRGRGRGRGNKHDPWHWPSEILPLSGAPLVRGYCDPRAGDGQ